MHFAVELQKVQTSRPAWLPWAKPQVQEVVLGEFLGEGYQEGRKGISEVSTYGSSLRRRGKNALGMSPQYALSKGRRLQCFLTSS